MPRLKNSAPWAIWANNGSSASLSNSSRASSASRRSTTTPLRSAVSTRACRRASFRLCGLVPTSSRLGWDFFSTCRQPSDQPRRRARREENSCPASDAISMAPGKAVLSSPAWGVFGCDKSCITRRVERLVDRRIVDLAFVRLMPGWYGSDLHVSHYRQMLFKARDQVSAHDLCVIKIELDADIRSPDLGDNVGRLLRTCKEVIRPVTRIDRLDQQHNVLLHSRISRAGEIGDQGGLGCRSHLWRHHSGEAV